jgi:hypothetical protein
LPIMLYSWPGIVTEGTQHLPTAMSGLLIFRTSIRVSLRFGPSQVECLHVKRYLPGAKRLD